MGRGKRYANYDSGMEQEFADHLRGLQIPFEYERDSYVFVKTIRKSLCRECGSNDCGQRRVYTPDFFLPNGVIIEVKGYFDAPTRERHKLIREQHPRLDLRLVFQRDQVISTSKNKIKYSDWCKDHDVTYWAGRGLPTKEWLEGSKWE